jgi:hypothetical protein
MFTFRHPAPVRLNFEGSALLSLQGIDSKRNKICDLLVDT